MASTSNFAATPRIGSALVAVANTGTRAVPVGAATLLTAGTNGTLLNRAVIETGGASAAAPAAKVVQLYLHDGTTYYLLREVPFAPVTPTTAVASEPTEVFFADLVLPSGWSIRAAISVRAGAQDDTFITILGADL